MSLGIQFEGSLSLFDISQMSMLGLVDVSSIIEVGYIEMFKRSSVVSTNEVEDEKIDNIDEVGIEQIDKRTQKIQTKLKNYLHEKNSNFYKIISIVATQKSSIDYLNIKIAIQNFKMISDILKQDYQELYYHNFFIQM